MFAKRSILRTLGMPQQAANMLGSISDMAVTAAGTTQGDAAALQQGNNISRVSAGTGGVILPSINISSYTALRNDTGSTITVYPAVGEFINNGLVNAGVTMAAGNLKSFVGTMFADGNFRWIST